MQRPPIACAPSFVFLFGSLLVGASASAQGSDSCGTPTVLSGGTTFPFDNAAATQGSEGQTNAVCATISSTTINRDVWFTWTAPLSGPHTLSTCGTTTIDTKLAVYAGSGCPAAAALACSDDACSLQSSATFSAVAGSTYTFQIGTHGSSPGGSGMFKIEQGGAACGSGTGPDVIVGNIIDIGNHTAANGIDAITLGTTSCNIGTQPLSWISNSNLHPVIGSTLYRWRVQDGSGRFEQIGMSWLKHGFVAESGSLCCACQGGGGSMLGVGCSDPYSASLNGSQPGLGPRYEVNAHTGVFAWPHANPAWNGSTARRLEFAVADIDTTAGVRYVGEASYVTQDDAAAGNQDNNSSWRELSVSGSGNFSFAFAGAVHRAELALHAWAGFESGVTLTDLHVPGDGHFIVGSKATDLGGGMWHYEFAVHNQNADRNAGSFSLSLPAGITLQNVGFHDVTYRNGDGPGNVDVSGADWLPAIGGGVITWSCETQAQNPGANAIRWSSTCNFRFDADVAPGVGNVVVGLWKPGSPGTMNATAQVPVGAGVPLSAYCFGDGSGAACPCGNTALPGSGTGCQSSLGRGALLGSGGTASVTADTFVLIGSGMPDAAALYFQGTTAVNGSLGALFGDGLRCTAGTVRRLGTQTNVMGGSTHPASGDLPISVQGVDAAGDVRYYQCWYRNAASFCTAATYNLTNGMRLTWSP